MNLHQGLLRCSPSLLQDSRYQEDREVEEVTESISGSPAAGLWIFYFYSEPPALLTDALMKDKTEPDREHTLAHVLHRYTGKRLSCSEKVSLLHVTQRAKADGDDMRLDG